LSKKKRGHLPGPKKGKKNFKRGLKVRRKWNKNRQGSTGGKGGFGGEKKILGGDKQLFIGGKPGQQNPEKKKGAQKPSGHENRGKKKEGGKRPESGGGGSKKKHTELRGVQKNRGKNLGRKEIETQRIIKGGTIKKTHVK